MGVRKANRFEPQGLSKLKGDQHAMKADVAIIVSQVLPKGVENFDQIDEIWVAGIHCLVPIAGSLRHLLIEVASTKRANEGHQDKAALVYSYVTSVGFRQRVKAMTETFTTMQEDLRREQTAIKKIWAKRESQLERIVDATTGILYQGRFVDKTISTDGSLVSLTLSSPRRFQRDEYIEAKRANEAKDSERKDQQFSANKFWKPIPTNMFIILAADIGTLNLR
jgi:hypothetical protein